MSRLHVLQEQAYVAQEATGSVPAPLARAIAAETARASRLAQDLLTTTAEEARAIVAEGMEEMATVETKARQLVDDARHGRVTGSEFQQRLERLQMVLDSANDTLAAIDWRADTIGAIEDDPVEYGAGVLAKYPSLTEAEAEVTS